ncbi:MCE family protein [Candidatus Dependentiae bacterium]|nr:MCE family protein [Candidatus Dependentiae bacterium]
MKEKKLTTLIGIITVVVIFTIIGLIARKITLSSEPKTEYKILVDHAAGLNIHDPVFLNGFRVGKVRSVEIFNSRALILISINETARISRDAYVGIEFYGLTGSLKISIVNPVNTMAFYPLDYVGYIECYELLPFEYYTEKIETFAKSVYSFDEYLLTISTGLANLEGINIREFKERIEGINFDLSGIETNITGGINTLEQFLASTSDNISTLNTTVNNLSGRFQLNTENYSELNGFRNLQQSKYFDTSSELYKNFDSLKYNYKKLTESKSEKDISWRLDTLYSKENNYIQNFLINTDINESFNYRVGFYYNYFQEDSDVELDLTVGKIYNGFFILRGGLVESTPGLGFELRLRKIRVDSDIFNMSDEELFFRAMISLRIFENFNLIMSYQNREDKLFYSGLGLVFDDNDLKRIFGVLKIMKTGE